MLVGLGLSKGVPGVAWREVGLGGVSWRLWGCPEESSWGRILQEGDGSDLEPPDAGEDSKSENGENAPIYCICRKPDINCFMM